MGFFKTLFGGSDSSSQQGPAFPDEIRALAAQQTKLGDFGLSVLEDLRSIIPDDFDRIMKEFQLFDKAVKETAENLGDPSESLARVAAEEFKNALADGSTSPEDIELIEQFTNESIAALDKDLQLTFNKQIKQIRDEFATSRGLRTDTDTPVGDRAARASADITDQFSRQASQLRATEAATKLEFGLKKQASRAQVLASARGGGVDLTNLKTGLQEQSLLKLNNIFLQRQGALQNLGAISTGGIPAAISGLARSIQGTSTGSSETGIFTSLSGFAKGGKTSSGTP